MIEVALEVLGKTFLISTFVGAMMVVVEFVNVWSRGRLTTVLQGARWRQYLLAALLGATPGCLGAFILVTLHVQRGISLGAVVAGMIATTGDELFVMLALFPVTAALMVGALALVGVLAGWATDAIASRVTHVDHLECCDFVEEHAGDCECFPEQGVLALWRPPRPERLVAVAILLAFVAGLVAGVIGEPEWGWERIALLVGAVLGLLVATMAAEPFLKEHVWEHVIKEHGPRILLWIGGALAAVAALEHSVDVQTLVADNRWLVLVLAALVGIIPVSGPHLVFVTLFADGVVPLSVLVANAATQDGHGMLPLLAHSRRDFALVKLVNVAVGLALGAVMMALGR